MKYEQLRNRASKRWKVSRDEFDITFPDTCSKHFLDNLATFAKRESNWTTAIQMLQQKRHIRKEKAKSRGVPDDWVPVDIPTATHDDDKRGEAWDTILWTTVPGNQVLSESHTLCISYFPEDRESLRHDPWLDQALELGSANSMAVHNKDGSVSVHQSLATFLSFMWVSSFSARHCDWYWLLERLRRNDLLAACHSSGWQPLNTIIFIQATVDDPEEMEAVYDCIQRLNAIHNANLRVYPRREEWWQETRKMGDIQVLDKIAQGSYRPVTCFGQGLLCKLLDCEKTVYKRTQSGSAQHVRIRTRKDKGDLRKLTCTQTEAEPTDAGDTQRLHNGKKVLFNLTAPWWFHQEYVPGLSEGEFKVFIATKPDPKGLRGLSGEVLAIAWISVDLKGKTFPGRAVQDVDFQRFRCEAISNKELEVFSLDIFNKLRKLSSLYYESLEVGVRLDVGVADDVNSKGGKEFFVNEITRWYNGHYFSFTTCADPKTQICNAFARSFSRVVQSSTSP